MWEVEMGENEGGLRWVGQIALDFLVFLVCSGVLFYLLILRGGM